MIKNWAGVLCIALFTAELAFGIHMVVNNGFIYGDAISRLANAFYVLFSRDPHLGAIGFIWNPLPSLLALPILLFRPLFPGLSSAGIAVIILSSLFAAWTAWLLLREFMKRDGAVRSAGVVCVLLFALHPFQFWYGANGMSEAMFGFFLAAAVLYWTQWQHNGGMRPLLFASIALAGSFLTRYEAIPFAAALTVATFLAMRSRRLPSPKLESSILLLILPIAFAVGSWIWLNYTIMGDPLYFLRSSYSNLGQSVTLENNDMFTNVIGNPASSLWFVLQRTSVFLLPYLAVILIRLKAKTWRRADFIALSLLVWSIPVFQWYMILSGSSFGWLRFFYYPFLIVMAWLPYELSLPEHKPHRRMMNNTTMLAFAVSILVILPAMNNPSLAPEEYMAIHYKESDIHHKRMSSNMNADWLDEEIFGKDPRALIVTDSFNAYEMILYSRYPNRFVNTTDRDFKEILEDPLAGGAEYILVPAPEGLNLLNAVLSRYPGLYDGYHEWVELEMELESRWRLFKVIGAPFQADIPDGGGGGGR